MDSALDFCFRCTECCRTFAIKVTKQEIEYIKRKTGIKLNTKKISPHRYETIPPCPFLKDGSCSIYDIRPCQCRLYHCGRLSKDDTIKPFMSEIQALMETVPAYKEYRVKMDEDGIAWGNNHGWNWRKQ